MQCVCPTSTTRRASAQLTQRGGDQAALLGTGDFTSCPENNGLPWLSCAWAVSVVLLRELHNWTVCGPWGTERETIAEIGLLGYITTHWIPLCWCAQILSGVCSGGGVQTELGILVGCMQVECTAVKCNVLMLPELWHCDTLVSFCLLMALVMAYGNSICFLCAPVLYGAMVSDGGSLFFFSRNHMQKNVAEIEVR